MLCSSGNLEALLICAVLRACLRIGYRCLRRAQASGCAGISTLVDAAIITSHQYAAVVLLSLPAVSDYQLRSSVASQPRASQCSK
jgi:hypothetical protein